MVIDRYGKCLAVIITDAENQQKSFQNPIDTCHMNPFVPCFYVAYMQNIN